MTMQPRVQPYTPKQLKAAKKAIQEDFEKARAEAQQQPYRPRFVVKPLVQMMYRALDSGDFNRVMEINNGN